MFPICSPSYHPNSCHFIKGRSGNPGWDCPQLFPGEMNRIPHWGPKAPPHICFSNPGLGAPSQEHSAQCCFVGWKSPMVDFFFLNCIFQKKWIHWRCCIGNSGYSSLSIRGLVRTGRKITKPWNNFTGSWIWLGKLTHLTFLSMRSAVGHQFESP